jgi:hypothetical protein
MSSYMFRQGCRPVGDFRIPQIIEFLILMKKAFRTEAWFDDRDRPVHMTYDYLYGVFRKRIDKRFPDIGVDEDFFSIPHRNRDDATIRVEMHTGTSPEKIFHDNYNISMSDAGQVPNFSYLRRSIEIFQPFEAFLAESRNEHDLDAYNRQQAGPKFDKPAIIRGFHYLDETLARSIGGIDYCLKAPAWKVERFCQGVLIQLVKVLFDSNNLEHLRIQREVMKYFGLM